MGANARAIEAGRFGISAAPLRQFVPMNGLAEAHISQLAPFAGVSELHPGDGNPSNFKTSDQTYYVVQGQRDLYTGPKLAGTVKGSTEETRFPLSHLQTRFDPARARGSLCLLRVDRVRVSKAQFTQPAVKSGMHQVSWRKAERLVSRAFQCAFWRTD